MQNWPAGFVNSYPDSNRIWICSEPVSLFTDSSCQMPMKSGSISSNYSVHPSSISHTHIIATVRGIRNISLFQQWNELSVCHSI